MTLKSPIFGPLSLGDALLRQRLSGGVAVMFERDEGEIARTPSGVYNVAPQPPPPERRTST